MVDLSTLNDNQRRAAEWVEGPLLVLAGPGSGKTRVLTFRIAHLIGSTPDKHFKVLALTFTNAAAAEMRQRVAELIPNASERVLLTTFHSFAADVLRQHGSHIGLKPDFTLLSQDADRYSLLDEAIGHRVNPETGLELTSEKLLPLISRLIENDVRPEKALTLLSESTVEGPKVISEIYGAYRRLMVERNTLDFAGLITEALGLLRSQRGVQKQVQRVYPYVCVDEFQDTNFAQSKILELIVSPVRKNIFVVADDDQIIYQWNGASPERLWAIRQQFDMSLLQLPQNYRCPSEVVELANRLIASNFDRSPEKEALTAYKAKPAVSVFRLQKFDTLDDEAKWIAADLAARSSAAQAKSVVLARTKAVLDVAVGAITDAGLPGFLATRKNEFEGASLQWLHSALRVANTPSSREQLRRVCKSFYTLEGINVEVDDVVAQAAAADGNFLRAWAQVVLKREAVSEGARAVVTMMVSRLIDRLDFAGFIVEAFAWLDSLPESLLDKEGVFGEYAEEKATWDALLADIRAQFGSEEVTLHLLLQELDLRSKSPAVPKNGIPCYTIHSSKGMEFDHVYLMGLVEDQLPSWAAIKKGPDSREMQEERRNCFVALTRSQETLTITYARNVKGWNKQPSRFLREMGLI